MENEEKIIDKDIHLRSDQVQEILEMIPNWMIRWGNTLILCLIMITLFFSWVIKYPDKINSTALITTSVPPEKLYSKTNGKIEVLLVDNNQQISKREIIAIVESSANYSDILLLRHLLDTIRVNYNNFYFPIEQLPNLTLGPIDSDYALFETSYTNYLLNKNLQPFSNAILAGEQSIIEATNRLNNLIIEKKINEQELELMKKDLVRFKSLLEKGVIAEQEFEIKSLTLLKAQRENKSISSSISQLRELVSTSNSSFNSTQIEKVMTENQLLKNTIQAFVQLKKSVKNWELLYAFAPSVSGKVSFSSFLTRNQSIKEGELIFTIIPNDAKSYIAKVKAPFQNSGKIKIGQKVNIKLENYPSQEFGTLGGIINSLSLVPDVDNNYLIEVKLPKKLVSSYGKEIFFKQEMIGTAEIITEDLRLIERFFYQLKNVFVN